MVPLSIIEVNAKERCLRFDGSLTEKY